MAKKEKKKAYKYYKFIVRTKRELGPATLEVLKRQIWDYLGDIAIIDIKVNKCSKPTIRFEGDPVVR